MKNKRISRNIPKMGNQKPKSGTHPSPARKRGASEAAGLAASLFGKTQQQMLFLLFGQPERAFQLSELVDLAQCGTGAVQRELARLTSSALVSVALERGRKVYKANHASPIFPELSSLIRKTAGIAESLRQALAPLTKNISVAILFGSVAKGTDRFDSDIDLLIVSETLLLEDIFLAVGPTEERLQRKINPTLYRTEEFHARLRGKNPFLTKVLSGPHQILIGEIDEHSEP